MKILLVLLLLSVLPLLGAGARAEDVLPAPTGFVSDSLYEKADAWPGSDLRALAAVMRKAEAGQEITVAVLGGSITEGTISQGTRDGEVPARKAYAEIFRAWWEARFPQTKINFVNAGIGGTDSYLGLHRVRQDVLSKNPDLVLVEYAVNDDGSKPFYKVSYDNLLRRILGWDNHPAVMLLFMGQTNGATAQAVQSQIGAAYGLPMVSSTNVFSAAMKSGEYPASVLSGDQVHPSVLGHALTGELLWRYLNGVYAVRNTLGEPELFDLPPVTQDKYLNGLVRTGGGVIPDDKGTFDTGTGNTCWHYQRGWINRQGSGDMTVTLTFKNLGILYQRTNDGKSGKYEVRVDGVPVSTLNGDFPGGWGNAITATEVYVSDESAEHQVTISLADGASGMFILLGFLTSD